MTQFISAFFIGAMFITCGSSYAEEIEFFRFITKEKSPLSLTNTQETDDDKTPPGFTRILLNESLLTMSVGNQVQLTMPNGSRYQTIIDCRKVHKNGDVSITGHLRNHGKSYRLILTIGEQSSYGKLNTPLGEYLIETDKDGTWLVNPGDANMQVEFPGDDTRIPPESSRQAQPAAEQPSLPSIDAGTPTENNSIIDVMVLYTPNITNPETRINQLVTVANTAYADSGVYMTLNLVHTAEINYSEFVSNASALDALTNGTSPFDQVASMRNQYGADLVSLLRPYDIDTHANCGYAWTLGGSGFNSDYGFSAVSDGSDVGGTGYYCRDTTFVHELGHNMGSLHDRAHAGGGGAYSYSYGYGIIDDFGTIMSYINPQVSLFSNPDLEACGPHKVPCGIVFTAADSADNRMSLNNSGDAISNFRPRVVFLTGDINGDTHVNLYDAILSLQVTVGFEPSATLYLDATLDNKTVQLADTIAILRQLSE